MEPNGYFSYEDIWLPGQFRAIQSAEGSVPVATAAGRENFPESRGSRPVKKLPAEVAVVLVVPPTLSTKVAQPGTAEAAEREACNSA